MQEKKNIALCNNGRKTWRCAHFFLFFPSLQTTFYIRFRKIREVILLRFKYLAQSVLVMVIRGRLL